MSEYSGVIGRIEAALQRIETAATSRAQSVGPDASSAAERAAHAKLRAAATEAAEALNALIERRR